MALQSTGPISFANIQSEFGGANPIGINEYYSAHTSLPSSGAISMNQFYGLANFNATWSGDSNLASTMFDTSGNLARMRNTVPTYGSWATAYLNGTFSNTLSSVTASFGFRFGSGTGYTNGISVLYTTEVSELRFTISGGFTGYTYGDYTYGSTTRYGLETSGGQLRFYRNVDGVRQESGAWVSLT